MVVVLAASAAGWTQVRAQDDATTTSTGAAPHTSTGTSSGTPSGTPSGPSSGAVTPARVVATAPTDRVRCWDGSTAPTRPACGLPQGRAGMTTVFPAITAACATGAATRPGSVEVYLCDGDGYVVRYTRWPVGYDRFTQLDRANDSRGTRWTVAGEFAGRTWSARSSSQARWAATYRAFPYSVEVIADDDAGRAAGLATVRYARAGHLGR